MSPAGAIAAVPVPPLPYRSHPPDANGRVAWSAREHDTWAMLYQRQHTALAGRACAAYVAGVETLRLPDDHIPQLDEVSSVLRRETGWEITPVPALIGFAEFFDLLSRRRFPSATFIRRREQLGYLSEPDIFHEIFGHAPMLTHPAFADFTAAYGRLGLAATREQRAFLARLYWFTVEFGLLQGPGEALSIYGGGILSSIDETHHALESERAVRQRFHLLDALRTPYRIDILQPVYYVLEDLSELMALARADLLADVDCARALGLFSARFSPRPKAVETLTVTV